MMNRLVIAGVVVGLVFVGPAGASLLNPLDIGDGVSSNYSFLSWPASGADATWDQFAAGAGIGLSYGSGTMTISATGAPPTGAAGGGLTGSYPNPGLASPSVSNLGGVLSSSAPANQFATGITTGGAVSYARPSFAEISGMVAAAQIAAGPTAGAVPYYTGSALAWGSGQTPPAWSPVVGYTAGNIVQDADGNDYISIAASTNAEPDIDAGANWNLWYLRSSVTLHCGNGQRFGGTSNDPAGLQAAVNFCAGFTGGVSGQTVTIQIADNPTLSVHSGSSATSFTTSTPVSAGQTLDMQTGSATNNIGHIVTVTGVTGPSGGYYTVTVSGSSQVGGGLQTTPSSGDTMEIGYSYAANPVTIIDMALSPFLRIVGDTTGVQPAPCFYPSLTAGSGGSLSNVPYYIGLTYVTSYGETMAGPVTSVTPAASGKITIAGFTLPAGATGANWYAGTGTGNANLKKGGSFTVTAGVAAAVTFTTTPTGAAPPTVDPAYPCWLSWTSVRGIDVDYDLGSYFDGLFITGDGAVDNVTGIGLHSSRGIDIDTSVVVSNWGSGIDASGGSQVACRSVQTDYCSAYGFRAEIGSSIVQTVSPESSIGGIGTCSTALFCADGFMTNEFSAILDYSAYAGNCTTDGYFAQMMSFIRIVVSSPTAPTSGSAQQAFGSSTLSSPAYASNGNSNSWVAN